MIRHIIRMVWNRKRSTGLLLVELLVSFLVLCLVFSAGAYYLDNWRKPLGFDYHNVLTLVAVGPPFDESNVEARSLQLAESARLMAAVRSQPEVEGISPLANTPYSGSMSRRGMNLKNGTLLQFMVSDVMPELKSVLRLTVVNGRWLDDSDAGSPWTSVVINRRLAEKLYGREDPIGRTIDGYDDSGMLSVAEREADVMKVVGVIDDYRKQGEFSESPYVAFMPMHLDDATRSWPAQEYLIRVAPGTPAAFEEKLLRFLQGVTPEYGLRIMPLSMTRTEYIRSQLLPLLIFSIVAGFLVLMVGMGLVGVLWQNVAQRSKEFGLRRALGATGGDIQGQVLGEMLALTTLAMLAGTILFLQIPMLKLPGFITLKTSLTAIGTSMLVLYPFVCLCSLYPSWLASAVQPVEALQHE